MRRGIRVVCIVIGLVALAVTLVLVGSTLYRALTPSRLAGMDRLIEAIWWPATALRCMVYAGLAWWVFPRWAERRFPAAGHERQHIERLRRRAPWVFAGLLGGDGVMAQLPYWLIHG